MKHTLKITIILLAMFLAAQLIGLFVVSHYLQPENPLPYNLQPPEITEKDISLGWGFLTSIAISFAIAIGLILILIKIKSVWFLRLWFFLVIILALGITLNAFFSEAGAPNAKLMLVVTPIAVLLAYFKVFKRQIIVHNLTELLIYPGIAAVFVPILNLYTLIILLIAISIYDIWAVWHSGFMQKMAKFQINKVGVFGGFFVPYADKKTKEKIKFLRMKYKNKKEIPQSMIKRHNLKIQLAILGGGDVIFPIIAAGVFLKAFSNLASAFCVILGALLALLYLLVLAKKRRYYPAMPYLTAGIFAGMVVGYLML